MKQRFLRNVTNKNVILPRHATSKHEVSHINLDTPHANSTWSGIYMKGGLNIPHTGDISPARTHAVVGMRYNLHAVVPRAGMRFRPNSNEGWACPPAPWPPEKITQRHMANVFLDVPLPVSVGSPCGFRGPALGAGIWTPLASYFNSVGPISWPFSGPEFGPVFWARNSICARPRGRFSADVDALPGTTSWIMRGAGSRRRQRRTIRSRKDVHAPKNGMGGRKSRTLYHCGIFTMGLEPISKTCL